MGIVEANPVGNAPQMVQAVASYAPKHKPGQPPSIGVPWSTGLFDCHEDQAIAFMTAILPCVTFGQISEILENGEMKCALGSFIYLLLMMPVFCFQWIMGSKYRTKLRQRFNLVEAPYSDIVSHIFCSCCSLCQEFRELRNRGFDPAKGWDGLLAEQQQATGTYVTQHMSTPPQLQFMSK
ncbi:unnamed protein product [Cuscuta epithymum]|uniref:Protein PLANT CADMIUM RESISTANCE 8 n=1 Tax=Cuscuta epithymum TaxID=186058 RepID=A0AAV0F9V0_9ASTE|nr:unnamed protein product [Cuscuta epithymum]